MSQQTPTTPGLATDPSSGGFAAASGQGSSEAGKAQQAVDTVRSGATAVGSDARDRVVDIRDTAQDEARTVVHDARDQAARVVGTTRDQLRRQADEQAGTVAQTLRHIGEQLSQMAESSDDQASEVVRLVRGAADQAVRSADHLDQGGIDTLMGDLTRTARTRPGLFLLGSAAAGFTVGRLVRHLDLGEMGSVARDALQGDTGDDASSEAGHGLPGVSAPAVDVPSMAPATGAGPLHEQAPPPPPRTSGPGRPGGPAGSGIGS